MRNDFKMKMTNTCQHERYKKKLIEQEEGYDERETERALCLTPFLVVASPRAATMAKY